MILIDFTQLAIGSLMVQMNYNKKEVSDDLVRHIILNNMKYYRKRFYQAYGELVLCCDNRHYWRREYFPNYKANRKKDRASSGLDWDNIFGCLNNIKDELKEHFPYKVLEVFGAEADDIIAVISRQVGLDNTIIISSDKDFIQLHNNIIDQYSPLTKKFITNIDPVQYLREHIIKGDRSDGVPNVLSADDTFVSDKRQKSIRKTTIAELVEQMALFEPQTLHTLAKCPRDTWIRNWQRNETLIDLSKIPQDIQVRILEEFDTVEVADRSNLLTYFTQNKLKSLMNDIQEF
jgi:5'-3' exonuclease